MSLLFSNRLTCCLHSSARLWKAVTAAACVRHHSNLIAELIENMDKKATWDRFYTENASDATSSTPAAFRNFEWFFGFESIRGFILPALEDQHQIAETKDLLRVLDLGCGTSAVGPSIYRHSHVPVHVTCADISPVAVALMQRQHQQQQEPPLNPGSWLDFLELDCSELHRRYAARSLDLIVDKGTVDSLLRSREGGGKAGRVLAQCLRALRRESSAGSLLQFSDEDPDARLPWLETAAGRWGGHGEVAEGEEEEGLVATVTVHEVGELRGVTYYCYQVTPRPRHIT